MSRYKFSSLAAGALLLLAGCQSDEFTWNGREIDSDEVMVTLYKPDFDKSLLATRAGDTSDEISEITVVMFDAGGNTLQGCYTIDTSSENWTAAAGSDNVYALTIPYSEVEGKTGKWYFFANARSKVEGLCKDANGLLKPSVKSSDLTSLTYTEAEQWNSSTVKPSVLFTSDIDVTSIEPGQLIQEEAVPLKHIYGKLNVKINLNKLDQKKYPLQVTGVALCQQRKKTDGVIKGDILGTAETDPDYEGTNASSLQWVRPATGETFTGGPSDLTDVLLKDKNLVIRTFPLAAELDEASGNNVMLIIEGVYKAEEDAQAVTSYNNTKVYYAVEVNGGVPANKEWNVTIYGVGSAGSDNLQGAIKDPSGISVRFEDANKEISSMVSDGENALAVNDTVYIDFDYDTQANERFYIRTRALQGKGVPGHPVPGTAGSGYLKMKYIGENGEETASKPSWFNFSYVSESKTTQTDGGTSLDSYDLVYKPTCSTNNGSQREFKVRFYFDHKPDIIYRDVLFIQKAKPAFNSVKDAFDITLAISGAASVDNTSSALDYSKFITKQGTYCRGLQPKENGDRIRNEGLHIPMPNDADATYTYTLTPKTTLGGTTGTLIVSDNCPDVTISGSQVGSEVTLSSASWTVSYKAGTNYDYAVYRDALILKVGEVEYKLDIYHTGFFHKLSASDNYCYYEVFSTGENGSGEHWLDRNLGAEAAGMAARKTSFIAGTVWPLSSGNPACGEYLTLSEATAKMPNGWTLPGYGNFEALYAQPLFEVQAITSGENNTFTAPFFRFSAKEVNASGANVNGDDYTIAAYFPCVQYEKNSSVTGAPLAGYYMTGTQTSGDYYRVAQFDGLNMIALNQLMGSDTKMTVRPVSKGTADSSTARILQCNVAGYTHVALYAENASHVKTWITTWPGEPVAPSVSNSYISDADKNILKVTKHFEKEVYYDYGSNLKVIFNTVNQKGEIVASNMVSESEVSSTTPFLGEPLKTGSGASIETLRAKRDGITFHNGGTYTREAGKTTPAHGAQNGNWTKNYTPEATITMQFPRLIKDGKIYDCVEIEPATRSTRSVGTITKQTLPGKAMTSKSGYYEVEVKVTYTEGSEPTLAELKTVIGSHRFCDSDGNYYSSTGADKVTWSGGSNKQGLKFGSYQQLNLNVTIWPANEGTATTEPAPAILPYDYYLYGEIHDGSSWTNGTKMTVSGGKYVLSNVVCKDGEFGIKACTSGTTTQKIWYNAASTSDIPSTGGTFNVNNKTQDGGGSNFKLQSAGTYTFTFDPLAMTLKVEKMVEVKDIYLRGEMTDNWAAKPAYKFSSTDGVTYTLSVSGMTTGKFKIGSDEAQNWTTSLGGSTSLDNGNHTVSSSGRDMTLKYGGNVTFTLTGINEDWTSATLTISGQEKYDCYIHGNIFTGEWKTSGAMEFSDGKYILSNQLCNTGNFGIRVMNKDHAANESNQVYWGNGTSSNHTITIGSSIDVQSSGNENFSLPKAGYYTFTFDEENKSLTVSGTSGVTLVFYWPKQAKDSQWCWKFHCWDLKTTSSNEFDTDVKSMHGELKNYNNKDYYYYYIHNVTSFADAKYQFAGDKNWYSGDAKVTDEFSIEISYPSDLKEKCGTNWTENKTFVLKYIK